MLVRFLGLMERAWPWLVGEIVWRAWRTPRRTGAVDESATPVMDLAETSSFLHKGRQMVSYRWGNGPSVILLVHGWEGRTSDFAAIVREVKSHGRTIIAFDAPGHGNSGGSRTTVIDYAEIIAEFARRYGQLDAVISHSLGTPSVAAAVRNGLSAGRFVSISGIAELTQLVSTFCRILGLSSQMADRVRLRIENRVFDGDHTVWARYSAAELPLPRERSLLVIHDRSDRVVSFSEAELLASAHDGQNRILATDGLGHSRILKSDLVLDAVNSFLDAPSQIPQAVTIAR